jgi:hypothetical protein
MRVTANGKVWRSEAEWRALCERFTQSGLGVAEFCTREKLVVSSLQIWYRRCAGAERRKGQFIEMPPAAWGAGRWEVEVALAQRHPAAFARIRPSPRTCHIWL